MKSETWIDRLKPGDEVAASGSGMNRSVYEIWIITKVTKQHGGTIYARRKGLDYQAPRRFDMGGWERAVGFNRTYLVELTQEVKDGIYQTRLLDWLEKNFDSRSRERTKKIPLEALEQAVVILRDALRRTEVDPSTASDPPSG